MHYKNDVDTNIVAVHHGFLQIKETSKREGKGNEWSNCPPEVEERERRQILLRKLCSTEKNVPIMALAGTTKVAEYEAQVCKLEYLKDLNFRPHIQPEVECGTLNSNLEGTLL